MSSRRELVGALTALIRILAISDSLETVRRGSVLAHAQRVADRASQGLIEPTPWTAFEERSHHPPTSLQMKALTEAGRTEAEALALFTTSMAGRLYVNSRYQVQVREIGEQCVHLSIKRIDQQTIHDWRDLQRIKDELIGTECEAVELYPAQSRVVDEANQYHLWAIRDATFRFPIGFTDATGANTITAEAVGSGQRPR